MILDASYVDQKKRTILDYKELQEPLLKVLRIIQDRKQLLGGEHGTGLIMF